MKHTTILLFLLLLGISGSASAAAPPRQQSPLSVLHIKLYDHAPFGLIVNREDLREIKQTHTLTGLQQGDYLIEVVCAGSRSANLRPQTVFYGMVKVGRAKEIYAYIDANGKFVVHQENNLLQGRGGNPYLTRPPQHYDDGQGGRPHTQHHPTPRPHGNQPESYGPASNRPAANQLSGRDLETLKQVMESKPFDSSRMDVAKEGISKNRVSTTQLREILGLLKLEDSRLELAKFTYQYVTDPERYFTLYDLFDFDDSVEKLKQFTN